MKTSIRLALDRLVLYLPAVLMAVFASGSWWLVRSLPIFLNESTAKAVRHEPDYFLTQFSVKSFDAQGRLSRELSGERAAHFPDTDVLDIDTVLLRGKNQEGSSIVGRAARALATGDGTEVTLIGQVVLIHQKTASGKPAGAPTEMRSELIHAFVKEERLVSDAPIEIRRGQDVFTAERMQMNSQTGEYELSGKVRGLVQSSRR